VCPAQLGSALPFTLLGEVDYQSWITVIPEAEFARDPLAALDAVTARYLEPSEGGWAVTREAEEMREALLRDAPKLTLCSGTGLLGDQLVRELFQRQRLRGATGGQNSTSCLPGNSASAAVLYASEPTGAWISGSGRRLGSNWTWCVEEVTAFVDYQPTAAIKDKFGQELHATKIVHVA